MLNDDALGDGERQALRALADHAAAIADRAEDLTVARLRAEGLLGARASRRLPPWARLALGVAAAAACFLAGVWSGRATHGSPPQHPTPTATTPGAAAAAPGAVVAATGSTGTTIIRF